MTVKAVAGVPGKPGSAHLVELPMPRVEDRHDGRGVLVKVLRVGLDGTDMEINTGLYGAAPPGQDFLVLGHESLGLPWQQVCCVKTKACPCALLPGMPSLCRLSPTP